MFSAAPLPVFRTVISTRAASPARACDANQRLDSHSLGDGALTGGLGFGFGAGLGGGGEPIATEVDEELFAELG